MANADGCVEQAGSQSFSLYFLPVLLVVLVFFSNFMARLILPPFLVPLEKEFALTHKQAGGLLLIVSLGISLSLLLSGVVSTWLTHRRTIVLSSLGVGLSLHLLPQANSLVELQAFFFLMGFAVGLYLPSGVSTITSILPLRHWGKGLAMHEMAPNLSFILAPAVAAAVEGIFAWQEVFAGLGTFSLIMGLGFAVWGRGGDFTGHAPRPAVIAAILRRPQFWLLALLFGVAVGTTFGIYSMLPLYLVKVHGLSPSWANNLLSVSRIPCLAMALGCGYLVDKIGAKPTILGALIISGGLTTSIGLLSGSALQAAVLLQPLCAVCFFPSAFAAISKIFDYRIRNIAISFIVPVAVLVGTGLVPSVLGWFGDVGHFSLGFVLWGVSGITGAFLVCFLQITGTDNDPCGFDT
ncbi:MAG: MFS transporter [Desulfovermiculus sp.]|nr:MFS transporter [Desulfovermiculus sp.]